MYLDFWSFEIFLMILVVFDFDGPLKNLNGYKDSQS